MQIKPIGRVLLQFTRDTKDPDRLRRHLSACAVDRDGRLWLADDESISISRLKSKTPGVFSKHREFDLADHLALPEPGEEIDIEGMDIDGDRLWLVGSHSCTRKAPRRDANPAESVARLATVERRPNRCLIASVQLKEGKPRESVWEQLPIEGPGNQLTEALLNDPHLRPFLAEQASGSGGLPGPLASKENGFDIEGIAAQGSKLLLGLRGPVLRGWAVILEIELEAVSGGVLRLRPTGRGGRLYRKHFVWLGGMGIRDLLWSGEDLLILSGPSMDLLGLQAIHRMPSPLLLEDDSLTDAHAPGFQVLGTLPMCDDGDKAEGMCWVAGRDESSLLIVYDMPAAGRLVGAEGVLADLFEIPR